MNALISACFAGTGKTHPPTPFLGEGVTHLWRLPAPSGN